MPESERVRAWAGVRCAECGREDDGSDERGCMAYHGDADDGGDEVLVFCPECSEREFGEH